MWVPLKPHIYAMATQTNFPRRCNVLSILFFSSILKLSQLLTYIYPIQFVTKLLIFSFSHLFSLPLTSLSLSLSLALSQSVRTNPFYSQTPLFMNQNQTKHKTRQGKKKKKKQRKKKKRGRAQGGRRQKKKQSKPHTSLNLFNLSPSNRDHLIHIHIESTRTEPPITHITVAPVLFSLADPNQKKKPIRPVNQTDSSLGPCSLSLSLSLSPSSELPFG